MSDFLSFIGESVVTMFMWIFIVMVVDALFKKFTKGETIPEDYGNIPMDTFHIAVRVMRLGMFVTLVGALFDTLEWTDVTAVGLLFLVALLAYPFAIKKERQLESK